MKAGNMKEYIETYREMKKRKKSNIIKDLNRDKQMKELIIRMSNYYLLDVILTETIC